MPRNPELNAYLTRLAGQDEVLQTVARETAELPNAGMQSRADQAALLTILTRMLDAQEAIEVGTFTGYGAICIARGLARGGRLTCFEVSEEYAEIARGNLKLAGVEDRVTVEVGPAGAALAALPDEPHIDLAYVDADKTGYPGYYDLILPRMVSGGLMLIDNVLLRGDVIDPKDERGRTVDDLNNRITADDRVDSVMVLVADGLTLARKR